MYIKLKDARKLLIFELQFSNDKLLFDEEYKIKKIEEIK